MPRLSLGLRYRIAQKWPRGCPRTNKVCVGQPSSLSPAPSPLEAFFAKTQKAGEPGRCCPGPHGLPTFLLAEEGGFEPPIGTFVPYNGLANRRLQPLGHPSIGLWGLGCLPETANDTLAQNQTFETPSVLSGGGRGIRTPGRLAPTTVFKTAAFNHSAIPPNQSALLLWDGETGLSSKSYRTERICRTRRVPNTKHTAAIRKSTV